MKISLKRAVRLELAALIVVLLVLLIRIYTGYGAVR